MPFKSARQRRYMYANHPTIARRWSAEGKGKKTTRKPKKKRKGY